MIDSPSAAEPTPPSGKPAADSNATPKMVRVRMPFSMPHVTYGLIGFTVFVFFLQRLSPYLWGATPAGISDIDWLEYWGARINSAILAGQVWRFLTPALLHGSFPHIFFNMYALYVLGVGLERYFGHRRFLILYVLCAFSGNVTSFLFTNGYSVGASTAIFGLIGAEGVFFYQNRKLFGDDARRAIGNVVFVAAINLFVIGSLPFIDNWGHIGGLLGGLMFTSLAGPLWGVEANEAGYSLTQMRPTRDVLVGAAAVVFVFGVLALWGMVRG